MPPIPPPPAPTEGPLTLEELQLAARNRGIPLEALRYDITPSGLHYLLVHFDIPDVDASTWRLRLGGSVERPLELTLEDIRARARRTLAVTIECAGNGRARLSPRPISQPWLVEAVSTAEWTGTPLSAMLAQTGSLLKATPRACLLRLWCRTTTGPSSRTLRPDFELTTGRNRSPKKRIV